MVAILSPSMPKKRVPMRYSNSHTLTGLIGVKSRLGSVRTRLIRLEDGVLSIFSASDDVSAPLTVLRVPSALAVLPDHKRQLLHVRISRKSRVTLSFRGSHEDFETWTLALRHANTMRVDEHYKLYGPIGRGHYAVVYEAMDRLTGEKVAVKAITKNDRDPKIRQYVRREAEIVKLVDHPNIVRTLDVFETDESLYIVMEFAEQGNLLKFLSGKNRINEKNAKRLARQLVSAIHYLHERNIIHRDVKPENMLIDESGNLKLADFGLARVLDGVTSDEYCLSSILGTPAYCSPEVVSKTQYGKPVDMYGCGVLLYIALSGALPFKGATPADVFRTILKGNVQFPPMRWAMISEDAKDFVKSLLALNGKDRPTSEEALHHPWLGLSFNRTPSLISKTPSPSPFVRNMSGRSDCSTGNMKRFRALGGRTCRSAKFGRSKARAFCRAPSGSFEELEKNRRAKSL